MLSFFISMKFGLQTVYYYRDVVVGLMSVLFLSSLSLPVSAKSMDEACYGQELIQLSKKLEKLDERNIEAMTHAAESGDVKAQVTLGADLSDNALIELAKTIRRFPETASRGLLTA